MEHEVDQGAVVKMTMSMWAGRMATYIMGFYALVQGFAIIFGERERFSAIGYVTALKIPGAPPSWGYTLFLAGLIALYGLRTDKVRWTRVGMAGCGVWSMFFSLTFAISALQHDNANLTATVVYGRDAILFILIAVTARRGGRVRDLTRGVDHA